NTPQVFESCEQITPHFTVIRSPFVGFASITTSLNSSNRPALCICQAIGPTLPAAGSLKSSTSTALLPGGCATAIRAVPWLASARSSTLLQLWASNFVLLMEVNAAP